MDEPAGRGQEPPESSGVYVPPSLPSPRIPYAHVVALGASELLLSPQHLVAELLELVVGEVLLGLLEHLTFFLVDVVLEVLLHDGELRVPGLVVG